MKPIRDLVTIDLRKKENLKSASLIETGTKAWSPIRGDLEVDDAIVTFRKSYLRCYVESASYLQVNLPFSNKVREYAQLLNPQKRYDQMELSSICNLALKVGNVFGLRSSFVFNVSRDKSSDDIVEIIMEDVPGRSYTRIYVFVSDQQNQTCSDSTDNNQSNHIRLDNFWKSVASMMNDDGNWEYPQLFALAKTLLSISHENVVPERGFSLNKYMLSILGNDLEEKTIFALLIVKEELCLRVGLENVEITKELFWSVHMVHGRYILLFCQNWFLVILDILFWLLS